MASSRSFAESFWRPRMAVPSPTSGRKSLSACAIMRNTLSFTGAARAAPAPAPARSRDRRRAGGPCGSPSGHEEAAVHVERDAVDVGGLVRGEEGDRGGLLVGGRDALDGHEVAVRGEADRALLRRLAGAAGTQERRVDAARADGVHAHAARAVVEGEVTREA